jgi:signal transduction histidine kinase
MGELAAGIAHEINQPLGGISMGLDNILFKLSINGIKEDYLRNKIDALFKDIDRIRQIINHVRVFSRDQKNLVDDTVNINDVINDSLSLISRQYHNHNIELSLNLSAEDCLTSGNKFRLEQVFLNLLSNAKYAVDEKSIMTEDSAYSKRIEISTSKDEKYVIAEIKDNGIGIPEKHLSNIFDPFFTTKDVETGTGLGLSISYGIIKEMKGEIEVESVENEYTKVIVIMPLAKGN